MVNICKYTIHGCYGVRMMKSWNMKLLRSFTCLLTGIHDFECSHFHTFSGIFEGTTLPETNSSPLKMDGWNNSFLLGPGLFSGANLLLLSGRVGIFCGVKRKPAEPWSSRCVFSWDNGMDSWTLCPSCNW